MRAANRVPVGVMVRILVAASIFAVGMAAGYALKRSIDGRRGDAEIRLGGVGYTNPLLECEVETYRPGRELPPFKKELESLVRDLLARGVARTVAVYFRDLDNGPWIGIDEDRTFTPGSLLKVPLMMACLLQADADPSFLAREVRSRAGSGGEPNVGFVSERPLDLGRAHTVGELMEHMIVYSDNDATRLLNDEVDRGVLERVYADLGLDVTMARDQLKRAAVSPKIFGRFFRVLYNASYLDRDLSEQALALLSRSTYAEGLVAGVPMGTTVAHKFGVFTESADGGARVQLHDCGIVYHARRPYFLCVMTEGAEEGRLAEAIARISRFVSSMVERDLPPPGPELLR